MTKRDAVVKEMERIPEPLVEEVLDFVRFLKAKSAAENLALAAASESSLRKDRLRPEEDEAWRDL